MIARSENYDFFEALYPDTADLYLAAHTKKGEHLRSAFFGGRGALGDLLAYADAHTELDRYYTVCPLSSKPDRGRGEARHAGALPCLWLDIDIAGPGHKGKDYPPTLEAALELAYGFPLEPSAIVYTGGGIHAYWLLKPWYLKTNEDQRAAHALSVAFQASFSAPEINPQGYALDRTADLARILRPPGTHNHKSAPPRPVRLLELHPDRRYSVEQVQAELAKLTPPAEIPAPKPERPAMATATRSDGKGRPDKLARARAYMAKVEPVLPGGRNQRAFELACKLHNDFDLAEDGFELLADWNSRNSEPLPEAEFRQTFQSALRSAKGPRGAALVENSPTYRASKSNFPKEQAMSEPQTQPGADSAESADGADGADAPKSQFKQLMKIADDWQLIEAEGLPWAVVPKMLDDGSFANETLRFDRGGVRQRLVLAYYKLYGRAPSSDNTKAAMETLEAKCLAEGTQERVWLRTARHEDRIYLDLCDGRDRAICISAQGWEIVQCPPVRFERPKKMLPLPEPVRGGSMKLLNKFLNLDRSSYLMTVAWLIYAVNPEYSKPILLLEAGQGSGKSCCAKFIRSLIDPSHTMVRGVPRNADDLAIYARSNWIPALDNLSWINGVPQEIADCACGIATGSGTGRRALYTDDQDHSFSFLRPQLWTAIPGMSARSDLVERTLRVEVPQINESQRKTEAELAESPEWQAAKPLILGAICDAVACALRNKGKRRPEKLPRLADFYQFVLEAADVLEPWDPEFEGASFGEQFSEVFLASRTEQVSGMIEACPTLSAISVLIGQRESWSGYMADLLADLKPFFLDASKSPKTVNSLGILLRVAQANLRHVGINLEFSRTKVGKRVHIYRTPSPPTDNCKSSAPLAPSALPNNHKGLRGADEVPTVPTDSTSLAPEQITGADLVPTVVPTVPTTQKPLAPSAPSKNGLNTAIKQQGADSADGADNLHLSRGADPSTQPRRKKYCRPEDLANVE